MARVHCDKRQCTRARSRRSSGVWLRLAHSDRLGRAAALPRCQGGHALNARLCVVAVERAQQARLLLRRFCCVVRGCRLPRTLLFFLSAPLCMGTNVLKLHFIDLENVKLFGKGNLQKLSNFMFTSSMFKYLLYFLPAFHFDIFLNGGYLFK